VQKHIRRYSPDENTPLLDGIAPVLARVYRHRGVQHTDELDYGLQHLPSPDLLKGIHAALDLLVAALQQQQRILVVGDFDADGATSTAVALRGLRAMGAQFIDYLVPDRFVFGYGLTPAIVAVACERKPQLIITVDNGISSVEGVAAARAAGIKVLVTDHHLPGAYLPAADAIVNPNQAGCAFPDKTLAGVGVMFYVLLALRKRLRDSGWFNAQRTEPNLASLLDLVALGTVADVVPMSHINRTLVQQGLLRIRAGQCCAGIRALANVTGRALPRLVATDFGFALAPRINAAGRLDDMSRGIECLLTDDDALAQQYAAELHAMNQERRQIQSDMQAVALNDPRLLSWSSEAENLPWSLCLYDDSWHQGVIGILAGRLREQFHRPAIAFADVGNGEIKGSARSVPGLHIRDALDSIAARHPHILSRFGGHAMAAGLTLQREHFAQFCELFEQEVQWWLDETDLEAVLISDGELPAEEITLSLAEQLRAAGPWGQRFPEPLFDGVFRIVSQHLVGEKHLKLRVTPRNGNNFLLDAIVFSVDTAQWPNENVDTVQLAYRLDVNEYNGLRSVQLLVQHVSVWQGD
jgi:single-stranded-DNA-specific exonuclease